MNAEQISLKINDDGVGGGVGDLLFEGGFAVQPVNAETGAERPGALTSTSARNCGSARSSAPLAGGMVFHVVGSNALNFFDAEPLVTQYRSILLGSRLRQ